MKKLTVLVAASACALAMQAPLSALAANHARAAVHLTTPKQSYVYGATDAQVRATIHGASGGTVTFKAGPHTLCRRPVTSGTVRCAVAPTALQGGTYPLSVRYSGSRSASPGTASSTLTVRAAAVTLLLTPSTKSVSADALSALAVTCTLASRGGLAVTGPVTLYLDGHLVDAAASTQAYRLAEGTTLAAGSHTLRAVYRGSADFASATQVASFTVVAPAATGLTPAIGPVTATRDGFDAQITNFNPSYVWSASVAPPAAVVITDSGLIEVTGATPGVTSTVTVTTTRAGSDPASATVSGAPTPPAATPASAVLTSITGGVGALLSNTTNGNGFLAQYYSPDDRIIDGYVDAGTTITMNWHVATTSGQALGGETVTLVDNLAGSGSTGTTWSDAGLSTTPDGSLTGTTDAQGNVAFTLVNTNANAGTVPSDTTTAAGAQANEAVYPFSRMELRVAADTITADPVSLVDESTDFVDVIVIPSTSATTNYDQVHGSLLWSETFNDAAGTAPSSAYWTPITGSTTYTTPLTGTTYYGTGEIEDNTSSATNVSEDGNGNLAISALCTFSCATPVQSAVPADSSWTSSRIWTQGKVNFEYGQIEADIKLPAGSFNWPAFWMLGSNFFNPIQWPNCGEIDIAEGLQGNNVDQATLHGNYPGTSTDWNGGGGVTLAAPLSNISAGYHTYGILWTPTSISFLLDGRVWGGDVYNAAAGTITQTSGTNVSTFSIGGQSWPFDQPFFLIFDDAIQAGTSAANGSRGTMLINWIKYYTYDGYGAVSG